MDFFTFIVHVFTPATRKFYSLERLWGDAERIAVADDSTGEELAALTPPPGCCGWPSTACWPSCWRPPAPPASNRSMRRPAARSARLLELDRSNHAAMLPDVRRSASVLAPPQPA